jgi:hypothetical protein
MKVYLDLKQQKRTLEPNEFTIDVSSEKAKCFFSAKCANQKLVIDLKNKTTYFEEYKLDKDGNFYSDYLADKVNGVYVPDMDTINAKKLEVENKIRIAEIDARLAEIDNEAVRPTRSIKVAELQGIEPEQFDIDKLIALENEVQTLRNERAALNVL